MNRGMCDVISDAHHLPFRPETFDKILLYSVLEHVRNPIKCMKEALRVAKLGARIEILIPLDMSFNLIQLRGMLLEFPFGVVTALRSLWMRHKVGKDMGELAGTNLQPRHLKEIPSLEITRIEKTGTHAWFQGRKGRWLKEKLDFGGLKMTKAWFIEAYKTSQDQDIVIKIRARTRKSGLWKEILDFSSLHQRQG